ncbi:MAG: extracellular solute-binding protein, partial [Lachnospiraceae bacterium]|nr:extracellular solute-binding protein [Lachnospiraceae bacterium]
MKKKVLGLLLSITMLASVLAGCGDNADDTQGSSDPGTKQEDTNSDANQGDDQSDAGEEDNGERIELTFWAWWSSDARKPYILEMVDGFNNSQTKYHVTYVDIGWGEIFTNNIAAIAAHDPCDIMANSMEEVRFRASQGQMEPMDEYLTDDVLNGFYSQYIDACKGEDGKVYALPYSVDTRAIYYNKDHFAEAGINPEDIKTWDDLIEAARKLDKKADDGSYERIGFMPVLGNGGIDTWMINANQGKNWYGDDLNPQPLVDTETNKEVLNWIRDQIDYYGQDEYTKLQEAFGGSMADPFASGKMSMLVHTSAYQAALANSA